jgi:hypothetical protein
LRRASRHSAAVMPGGGSIGSRTGGSGDAALADRVKKFCVSPDESALQKVGNSVAAVQQELS